MADPEKPPTAEEPRDAGCRARARRGDAQAHDRRGGKRRRPRLSSRPPGGRYRARHLGRRRAEVASARACRARADPLLLGPSAADEERSLGSATSSTSPTSRGAGAQSPRRRHEPRARGRDQYPLPALERPRLARSCRSRPLRSASSTSASTNGRGGCRSRSGASSACSSRSASSRASSIAARASSRRSRLRRCRSISCSRARCSVTS